MTTSRETFLQRVRTALDASNRPGAVPPRPERGTIGYQGGGTDLAGCFCEQLSAAGGQPYRAPDHATAIAQVLRLVKNASARRILLGKNALIDALDLFRHLSEAGCEVVPVDRLAPATSRDAFFGAELGISSIDYLIAETGSLVALARPDEPRSLSLLPPIHVVVARQTQIVADLFDLFEGEKSKEGKDFASCLTLITGPSKTGDIELRLVTGVHGPGEVHVVLIAD